MYDEVNGIMNVLGGSSWEATVYRNYDVYEVVVVMASVSRKTLTAADALVTAYTTRVFSAGETEKARKKNLFFSSAAEKASKSLFFFAGEEKESANLFFVEVVKENTNVFLFVGVAKENMSIFFVEVRARRSTVVVSLGAVMVYKSGCVSLGMANESNTRENVVYVGAIDWG